MNQILIIGETIGYGDSYVEFLFRQSKVLTILATLNDAAGAVRSDSGKVGGYCYTIGRGPNSYLLDHVIGLLLCLYVKTFLSSTFNSVDFWSSMFCIVLEIVLADKNVRRKLEDFW